MAIKYCLVCEKDNDEFAEVCKYCNSSQHMLRICDCHSPDELLPEQDICCDCFIKQILEKERCKK